MLNDTAVKRTVFAARRVSNRAHRYLQFTRFVKCHIKGDGTALSVYVADIEPQYDILHLIAGHFTGDLPANIFDT